MMQSSSLFLPLLNLLVIVPAAVSLTISIIVLVVHS
jgi:hypothetical protein